MILYWSNELQAAAEADGWRMCRNAEDDTAFIIPDVSDNDKMRPYLVNNGLLDRTKAFAETHEGVYRAALDFIDQQHRFRYTEAWDHCDHAVFNPALRPGRPASRARQLVPNQPGTRTKRDFLRVWDIKDQRAAVREGWAMDYIHETQARVRPTATHPSSFETMEDVFKWFERAAFWNGGSPMPLHQKAVHFLNQQNHGGRRRPTGWDVKAMELARVECPIPRLHRNRQEDSEPGGVLAERYRLPRSLVDGLPMYHVHAMGA